MSGRGDNGRRTKRRGGSRSPWRWLPLALPALAVAALLADAGCVTASLRPPRRSGPPLQVAAEVTGYCNCRECCSWRRTWWGRPVIAAGPNQGRRKAIGITSSGVRARLGTVAADLTRYPVGTIVHVAGYGYGRVEDSGGAITGDALDLWFPTHARAAGWGRKRMTVSIWLPPGATPPQPLNREP